MTRVRPRPPSIRVERDVALRMLGWSRSDVDLDHDPALGLRAYDAETGIYTPAADDPEYLVFRARAEHARKTRGNGATTAGSDIHAIAKGKRLSREHAEFRARMLAKSETGVSKRHGSRIPSRPFPKGSRPMNRARTI